MSMLNRMIVVVIALLLASSAAATALAQAQTDRAPRPVLGERVNVADEEGTVRFTVTLNEIIDPFTDFSEFFSPDEDARYLAFDLTVSGVTGANVVTGNRFRLTTTDGFIYNPTFVSIAQDQREMYPELPRDPFAPDEELSGYIYFALPPDAAPDALYYAPETDRLIFVADLRGAEAAIDEPLDPTPAAPDTDPDIDPDLDPGTPETGVVGDVNCDIYASYYEVTLERFNLLNIDYAAEIEAITELVNTDPDTAVADLRDVVDRIAELGDEQFDMDVPEGLEDLNDQIVLVFDTYAEAFGLIADGIETGDQVSLNEAQELFDETIEIEFAAAEELDGLATDCGILAPAA